MEKVITKHITPKELKNLGKKVVDKLRLIHCK